MSCDDDYIEKISTTCGKQLTVSVSAWCWESAATGAQHPAAAAEAGPALDVYTAVLGIIRESDGSVPAPRYSLEALEASAAGATIISTLSFSLK